MNLGSLAIDIQIRLNKYPLQNEPGFEKDFDNQKWLTEEKAARLFDSKVLLPGFVIE